MNFAHSDTDFMSTAPPTAPYPEYPYEPGVHPHDIEPTFSYHAAFDPEPTRTTDLSEYLLSLSPASTSNPSLEDSPLSSLAFPPSPPMAAAGWSHLEDSPELQAGPAEWVDSGASGNVHGRAMVNVTFGASGVYSIPLEEYWAMHALLRPCVNNEQLQLNAGSEIQDAAFPGIDKENYPPTIHTYEDTYHQAGPSHQENVVAATPVANLCSVYGFAQADVQELTSKSNGKRLADTDGSRVAGPSKKRKVTLTLRTPSAPSTSAASTVPEATATLAHESPNASTPATAAVPGNSHGGAPHVKRHRRTKEQVEKLRLPNLPKGTCTRCKASLDPADREGVRKHLVGHHGAENLRSGKAAGCLWCKKRFPGQTMVGHVLEKHLGLLYGCPLRDKEPHRCMWANAKSGYVDQHLRRDHGIADWDWDTDN